MQIKFFVGARGEPGNEASLIQQLYMFPFQNTVIKSSLHYAILQSKCTTTIARPTLQNKVVAKYLVTTNACVITFTIQIHSAGKEFGANT